MILTSTYSIFTFTYTVVCSFRMEGAFIFFVSDSPFGWIDKAAFIFFVSDSPIGLIDKLKKCKNSFRKKLSNNIRHEKWWHRTTVIQLRQTVESATQSCPRSEEGWLCWMSGFFSYFLSENKFLCLLNAKTKTQLSWQMKRNIECG